MRSNRMESFDCEDRSSPISAYAAHSLYLIYTVERTIHRFLREATRSSSSERVARRKVGRRGGNRKTRSILAIALPLRWRSNCPLTSCLERSLDEVVQHRCDRIMHIPCSTELCWSDTPLVTVSHLPPRGYQNLIISSWRPNRT